MKALVFAAGLGTRLKPFTLTHPKALAPVAGKPMLQRVIEKLTEQGVTEIIVNVHHFPDQIIDFLHANNFDVTLRISDERDLLLDTGGGLLAARKWLDCGDEPFIIHNADILTDFDLRPMVDAHTASGAMATLLVADRTSSRMLLFDRQLSMRGWANMATGETRPSGLDASALLPLAFGGVHVASPSIFTALERYAGHEQPFSITPFYIEACGSHLIKGYMQPHGSIWFDIGKPESLDAAGMALQ